MTWGPSAGAVAVGVPGRRTRRTCSSRSSRTIRAGSNTPRDLPRPPAGEAHFTIDQTVDTIAYWDLKTAFRFATDEQHVAVTNAGTKGQVVADAVRFLRVDGKANPARSSSTTPRPRGTRSGSRSTPASSSRTTSPARGRSRDNGEKKGMLSLRYVPTKVEGWDRSAYYRVGVGFPGKAGNETRAPIVVRAAASSPIVRLQAPKHVHVGAEVTLDAGASYNIQDTPLKVTWVQVGGPKVVLVRPARAAARPSRRRSCSRARPPGKGWHRALIVHPDFLFTRPVSLATTKDPRERARLQLVKIALDLVGRSPTKEEVDRLDAGATLEAMVDRYLGSEDFRDFYFHRIRLYLESQGTEEQDEPVRLWSYIASTTGRSRRSSRPITRSAPTWRRRIGPPITAGRGS